MSANSLIIQFGYYEHEEYEDKVKQKHRARCKFCDPLAPKLTEFKGTTSGFTRHLRRRHKAQWQEYLYLKGKTSYQNAQDTLYTMLMPQSAGCSSSASPSNRQSPTASNKQTNTHKLSNAKQIQISEAVTNFVIGCSLPLTIVEDAYFRNLLQCLDPRFQPITKSVLTRRVLPQLRVDGTMKILNMLAQQSNVSLTANIWTDRALQSFLAVTAHIIGINPKTGDYGLIPLLLTCQHFYGENTGEQITQAFNATIENYDIANKVNYIVTDSAAGIKQAFKVKFPIEEDGDAQPMGLDEEQPEIEDETLWEELNEADASLVYAAFQSNSRQRLSCFEHTLQLVVCDGLKEMGIGGTITKMTTISSLIHKNTVFKQRFECKFGTVQAPSKADSKCWHSTYHQIKTLLTLDGMQCSSLAEVCDTPEFAHVLLTSQEWGQLVELYQILEPFAEAISLTQGDQRNTIGQVVPVILDINSHLSIWRDEARFCQRMVTALQSSLKMRFRGIFINCCMDTDRNNGDSKQPLFMDKIYLISAVIDPQYMLHWVDTDVTVDGDMDNARQAIKDGLKELVIMEAERLMAQGNNDELYHTTADQTDVRDSTNNNDETPAKVPRLLAKYKSVKWHTGSGSEEPVRVQLDKYLKYESYGMDAVTFWREDGAAKLKYPALYKLAKNMICVPTRGVPVEHIFSKGGVIVRPHRARLSPQMLETLMFLKCNEHVL